MKKLNSKKILALAVSCVLFICGIVGISASAQEDDVSAEFVNVTLNYGAETRIAYALSVEGAAPSEVALELYSNAELSGVPAIATFSGSYYDASYPVYYSYGIAAKDLADYVYARPVLSGEVIGDTCRYSVAQYCYSVLSNHKNDETLLALAEDLLAYGASAQSRLIKIGNITDEALVTDYGYAYAGAAGVIIDGKYGSALVAPDAKVIPSYLGEAEVKEWKLTSNGASVTVSADEAAKGITISGITAVEPIFSEGFVGESFDSGKITSGKVVTDEKSTNTTVTVDKDPENSSNNVLKVVQQNSSSSSNTTTDVYLANPDATGNCYTFEFKVYFSGMDKNTSPQDLIQMQFCDGNNKAAVGYGFKENSSCDKIYFNLRNSVTGGTGNASVMGYNGEGIYVASNVWYTLRYELYATGDEDTTVTKIYIGADGADPVCVSESYGYRDASITNIKYARLNWQKYATEYTIYVDDLLFVKSDKMFETSKPVVREEGFDNADTSVYLDSNNGVYSTFTEGGNTPSIASDPENSANNVLKIQKVANVASAYTYVKMTEKAQDASCYTYSQRIYFGTPTNSGDAILNLSFLNESKASIAKLTFATTYVNSGVPDKVFVKDGVVLKDFTGADIALVQNTWYDLKIELYDLGDGTGKIKLYLAKTGESLSCVAELSVTSMSDPTSVCLGWEKNKTKSVIYVDDVMLLGEVKAYTAE